MLKKQTGGPPDVRGMAPPSIEAQSVENRPVRLAKLGQTLIKVEKIPVSYKSITNNIAKSISDTWKNKWKNTQLKNITYLSFNMLPGQRNIKHLSKITNKLQFSTIMQLKIGHGYFKSYQYKRSIWTRENRIEDDLCPKCNKKETPEHLILHCQKYQKEIDNMRNKSPHTINLQYLFATKAGQRILIQFLKNTGIGTTTTPRGWIYLLRRMGRLNVGKLCYHGNPKRLRLAKEWRNWKLGFDCLHWCIHVCFVFCFFSFFSFSEFSLIEALEGKHIFSLNFWF